MGHDGNRDDDARGLSSFIHRHRKEIISDWEHAISRMLVERGLSHAELIDHIPMLLTRIGEMLDAWSRNEHSEMPQSDAERHALERLDKGFDLGEVVTELAQLRDCILQLWEEANDVNSLLGTRLGELRALNAAIDKAIAASVERYASARQRMFQALDRVSTAALSSHGLEDLLERLLRALQETTPAVDMAVILLRDADTLRMEAAVGLDMNLDRDLHIKIGEGFSGSIAETLQPMLVHAAYSDVRVESEAIRARGIRALYGVPLIDGMQVIGVASMGSLTAQDFSEQDKQLFQALANRATLAIVQSALREASERRARQAAAVSGLGLFALNCRDLELIMAEVSEVVRRTLNTDLTEIFELGPSGDSFVLRAGAGWNNGLIGQAVICEGRESQAGFTLVSRGPVVVPDLKTERRFNSSSLLLEQGVVSGLSVIIQAPGHGSRPYGVLGAHTFRRRAFSQEDVDFLQAVANVLASAVLQHRSDETRRESEERLQKVVDERKRLLDDIARKNAELEAVFESIPDAVYVGDITGIKRVNSEALAQLGFKAPGELNQRVSKLAEITMHRDPMTRAPMPADRQVFLRALQGEACVHDAMIRHLQSGEDRVIRSAAAPIKINGEIVGAVAVNTDITDRRRNEDAQRLLAQVGGVLIESRDEQHMLEQVARLAVEHMGDWCAVHMLEPGGKLRQAAAAHRDPELTRLMQEAGEHFQDWQHFPSRVLAVIQQGEPRLVREVSEAQLEGDPDQPEQLELLRRLGIHSLVIVPLVASGQAFGAITLVSTNPAWRFGATELAMARDLSGHVALAIDNARLFHEFENAVHIREQVLAIVSHDLRNPLNTISLGAAVMARRAVAAGDERLRKQVELIQRSAVRMDHLIADLRDMASLQAGRLQLERLPESAVTLVEEAIELHEPLALEKGLSVKREVFLEDVQVLCDRDRVQQVFSNLVGNAIKFSEAGGQLTIKATRQGDEVCFMVADTGPGISPEDLPRIFDPYWSARRHVGLGTGLGLFIARGIVEAHGGRVWAESEPGNGAALMFTLPVVG